MGRQVLRDGAGNLRPSVVSRRDHLHWREGPAAQRDDYGDRFRGIFGAT